MDPQLSKGRPKMSSGDEASKQQAPGAGLKFKSEAAKVDLSLPSERQETPDAPPVKLEEAVKPSFEEAQAPSQEPIPAEDVKMGPLTTGLLILVIVAFVCWVGWLIMKKADDPDAKRPVVAKPLHIALTQGGEFNPDLQLQHYIVIRPKKDAVNVPDSQKADVNTATKEQLQKIPGVNEWIAGAIIKRRPYKSLDELLEKSVIGETRLADAKPYFKISAAK